MVTCDRDSAYVEDANGEMQSCIPVHGDESYWPPEVDQAHRAGDKRTAVKRAATFPAMGFGIGRTGLRLLLRCCQEFFSVRKGACGCCGCPSGTGRSLPYPSSRTPCCTTHPVVDVHLLCKIA
jgi:ribosomal protein L37E